MKFSALLNGGYRMTLLELAQTRSIDCGGLDADAQRLIEALGFERWLERYETPSQVSDSARAKNAENESLTNPT
jgi:hypothetical protein